MLLLAGLLLIVLGLISGAALLAAAIGWLTLAPSVTLWVMFPFASALGLLIAALGARTRTLPALLRTTGSVMLLFALAAVAMLVLGSAGLLHAPQETAALWYVFGVGLVVGVANFLAPASPSQPI
jgi:hypothetical protein